MTTEVEALRARVAELEAALTNVEEIARKAVDDLGPTWSWWSAVISCVSAALAAKSTPPPAVEPAMTAYDRLVEQARRLPSYAGPSPAPAEPEHDTGHHDTGGKYHVEPCATCGGTRWTRSSSGTPGYQGQAPCPDCAPAPAKNEPESIYCAHGRPRWRDCDACDKDERDAIRAQARRETAEECLRAVDMHAIDGAEAAKATIRALAPMPPGVVVLDGAAARAVEAWRGLEPAEQQAIIDRAHMRTGSDASRRLHDLLRALADAGAKGGGG